ncbi:unnamed protein product [Mucor hiemalis]
MDLSYIQCTTNRSLWCKLANTNLWRNHCARNLQTLDKKQFLSLRRKFTEEQFLKLYEDTDSTLLPSLRRELTVDPILWPPMTTSERSRILRWRLGWLPGGRPKECIYYPGRNWSRRHTFTCLKVHSRLYLPLTIEDPISFLLNQLPLKKPPRTTLSQAWVYTWLILRTILHELDYYFHDECPPPPKILVASFRFGCLRNSVCISDARSGLYIQKQLKKEIPY